MAEEKIVFELILVGGGTCSEEVYSDFSGYRKSSGLSLASLGVANLFVLSRSVEAWKSPLRC